MILDDRLEAVAGFVPADCKVADIGTDHGYLAMELYKRDKRRTVIAAVKNAGPCQAANHIFVDKRGPRRIKETYDKAREILRKGMSVVVFPEGSCSFTGHMGEFRRGAFMLADELQLPICPITINGSFNVMPRTRDMKWVIWHPLSLTIHKPIMPKGKGVEYEKEAMREAYQIVMDGLVPEYKGYKKNPDQ